MQTVIVNNQRLGIKEYKGQRVVTFADIDAVHGRPEGTAGRNFRANKNRFVNEVDFFKISQPDEFRRVGITSINGGIVITESGYLMLVKSFTDDLAWQVQRELVNSYFKVKEEPYEYFDKTYNGEAVITLLDFAYFTGKTKDIVSYHLRNKNLIAGKDFYLIDGENLRKFKTENSNYSKWCNNIYLITKSGFTKLTKILGIKVQMPECFSLTLKREELPPPVTTFLHGNRSVVDVPENTTIQQTMQTVRQLCNAITVMVDLSNKYYLAEEYEKIMYSLDRLGYRVSSEISKLKDIKPKIIEKYI